MRIFDSIQENGRRHQHHNHHTSSVPNLVRRPNSQMPSNSAGNNSNSIDIRQMAQNNHPHLNNNNNNININNNQHQRHQQQATKWSNKSTTRAQLEVCQAEFWRSILAECLSSCIYVFIVCSTRISWTGSIIGHEPNLVAMAIASGLTMKLLIYSFRSVHINPALTISLFLLMRISLLRTVLYIFAQCLGAIAASAFLYLVSVKGHGGALGIDNPHEQLLLWHVLVVELVISFLVTFVTYATFSWSTYKTFISSNSKSNNCTSKADFIDSQHQHHHQHIRNTNLQAPYLISNHYNRVCDDATSNIISDIRTNKSQMAFNTNLTVSNRNNNNNQLSHNTMQPGQNIQHNNSNNNNQLIFNNQEQVENFIATIQQQTNSNNNNNNQPDSGYSNSSSSNGNNNNNRTIANNRIDYASELSCDPANNIRQQQQQHYPDAEHYLKGAQQNHRNAIAHSDDYDDDGYDNHRLYAATQLRASLNQPSGADSTFNQALAPNGFPVHFTGNQALVIGLSYIVATLTGIPASGASLNPARSLGPAFIMNRWTNHWVFWLGPMAGAILAAFVYEFVFNPLREKSLCFRPSIFQQTNCQDGDDDVNNNLKKQTIKYQRSPLVKSSSSFRSIQSNTPAALVKSTLNLPTQFSQHLQHPLSTTITSINPSQPEMFDKPLEPQFHHHMNFQNHGGGIMINDDQNVNYDRVIYADPNSSSVEHQQLVDTPRPLANRNLMGYRPKSSQHIESAQMNAANQLMSMSTTLGFRAQQRLVGQFDPHDATSNNNNTTKQVFNTMGNFFNQSDNQNHHRQQQQFTNNQVFDGAKSFMQINNVEGNNMQQTFLTNNNINSDITVQQDQPTKTNDFDGGCDMIDNDNQADSQQQQILVARSSMNVDHNQQQQKMNHRQNHQLDQARRSPLSMVTAINPISNCQPMNPPPPMRRIPQDSLTKHHQQQQQRKSFHQANNLGNNEASDDGITKNLSPRSSVGHINNISKQARNVINTSKNASLVSNISTNQAGMASVKSSSSASSSLASASAPVSQHSWYHQQQPPLQHSINLNPPSAQAETSNQTVSPVSSQSSQSSPVYEITSPLVRGSLNGQRQPHPAKRKYSNEDENEDYHLYNVLNDQIDKLNHKEQTMKNQF